MARIPHLKIPLELAGNSFATVEQDSPEDIAQCVKIILRTPFGSRDDVPTMGLTEQRYRAGGPNLAEIERQILEHEPRVDVLVELAPLLLDEALAEVGVRMGGR